MPSSPADDLTAKARIRETALELFAEQGFAVSTREIAKAAGVSPALVTHHFGSSAGLREAVDGVVVARITGMLGDPNAPTHEQLDARWRAMFERFAREPALADYLARSLREGDEASAAIFDRLLALLDRELALLEEAGLLRPSADPQARRLLIALLDLGPLVMRRLAERELGSGLFEADGYRRIFGAMVELLQHGMIRDAG
jgi:AcrR family transcriptional regulator